MWCLVLYEIIFNNNNVSQYKISVLANAYKNYIMLALLSTIITIRSARITHIVLLVSTLLVLPSKPLTLALTNTLFIIHPPMLYVFAMSIIYGFVFKKNVGMAIIMLLFAIGLGGVWSMQELNWGGWWNWDVLECGIAYFWMVCSLLSHLYAKKSRCSRTSSASILIYILVIYTVLNKYGIGTSIHSFVASKNLKTNYFSIFLFFCLVFFIDFSKKNLTKYYYVSVILTIYIYFKTLVIFKFHIAYAVIFFIYERRKIIKPMYLRDLHSFVKKSATALVMFNYYNYGFGYNFYGDLYATFFFSKKIMPCVIASSDYINNLFIWKDIWLIKPKYAFGGIFEINSTRTLSLRFFSHLLTK